MVRIEVHGNTPLEGGPGNAQILQTGQKEVVHHLVLSGYGLDELGMGIDMVDQAVGVFLHLEEVGFFLGRLDLIAADRALVPVHYLGSGIESFAFLAVEAFIVSLIDIALLIELFEDLLDLDLMVLVRSTDEPVIGGVHQVPEAFDLGGVLVHEGLGGHAGPVGTALDLLSVFVGACLEIDVIAVRSLVSCDGICQYDLVAVADVGLAGGIGDGRCNIVFSLI